MSRYYSKVSAAFAVIALPLASCTTGMPGDAQTGAEAACVEAVDARTGSRGAEVMASETAASGTRVLVLSQDGRTWTCGATSSGEVQSLSVG
jgi:hypothetical protein